MLTTHPDVQEKSWLDAFLSEERFWPAVPGTLEDAGLTAACVESLICKQLVVVGTSSGRAIADKICLPFRLLEDVLLSLRTRQLVVHTGSAPFNDYYYMLTEHGQKEARAYRQANPYVGPAPVPLRDYIISVEAQCISTESPTDEDLERACSEILIDRGLFDAIGPAMNSGAGMFLYGAPGNGKSTVAERITLCYGQELWIPRVIMEDDHLIKLFDASCHHEVADNDEGILKSKEYDRRWTRIKRPTVVVGGELTMDSLEFRHDASGNISEAPLQMKSNGGCLVIDDFGRQRVEPAELLNRWIVPLETGHDYLTLSTGKKIKVPFEQLIIFSTNLEPRDLVDEAFLRRIPYKIEIGDPSEEEFYQLFQLYSKNFGCEYHHEAVEHLLDTYYRPTGRKLRRCQPRDLLRQIKSYCAYRRIPFEMSVPHIDKVAKSYLTVVLGDE